LIASETSQRIRAIAAELGYYPSAAARSLKTNRSQVIGVIVSHIADPFFSEILQGIDDLAQQSGYSLFIAAAQHDPEREKAIVKTMREHRVDGVILCSTPFSPEQSQQLLAHDIPIVVVNNQAAEDYRYSIYHDDLDGSRQLTRHLLELGHRRIGYLGNALSGRTNHERLSGFQQEMSSAGTAVPPAYIYLVNGGAAEDGLAGINYFLHLPLRPTALVCFNDLLAVGALKGLDQAGLHVPGQFSLTGFDNIVYSEFTNPPLTTFDQPKRFIGTEAARMMLELLNKPPDNFGNDQSNIRLLCGTLLIRQSTAPPEEL
jgi:LacI family transcriptional regulator/LacI family repressor for deo operon, udp, cdd, tsx, nupC, and nupG